MRTILAFVLALVTVLFALDNQTPMTIILGPFEITETVAIIVIGTFIFGIVTGIVATLPNNIKRRRLLRSLSE